CARGPYMYGTNSFEYW
nr:immunoglobulin heavy chain junction region [Macaca mulatta]MOX38246.1 immunoglobulin heavy chain junction region [Macaca mulatta]MOX38982.1 immunoglobulin heavy chain junction region [Macaca mulatta]MOX39037.1 immunoglobulin heavy chain junction region [Macaca mulatta]MOX40117.1 immunoglobulin heavy chain junction region [Macaca mulatta]